MATNLRICFERLEYPRDYISHCETDTAMYNFTRKNDAKFCLRPETRNLLLENANVSS